MSRLPHLRPLVLALILLLLPGAAEASGGAKAGHTTKPSAEGGHDAPVQALDPKVVSIAVLVAPVVDQGRLTGYLYLSVNIRAKSETEAAKIKRDLPLIQDALLRRLYAHPIEHERAMAQDIASVLAADLKAASASLIDLAALEALEVASLVRVPL